MLEKRICLRDNAHHPALDRLHPLVTQNGAAIRLIQACEDPEKCSLSHPGRPQQSNYLPLRHTRAHHVLDLEMQITKNLDSSERRIYSCGLENTLFVLVVQSAHLSLRSKERSAYGQI